MKYKFIIFLLVIGYVSCKKDTKTNTTAPTPTTVSRSFFIPASDENDNRISSLTGNTFIVNFYQNGNVIYTAKTKETVIVIDNFKDGNYLYEITDSLNLFGYSRDSIIIRDNSFSSSSTNAGTTCTWTQCPSASLSPIQKKPIFSIISFTAKDTVAGISGAGIYIKVNVSSNVNTGAIVFYFYKNNNVSSNNLFNYAPLYPESPGHFVSSTQTSVWDIFSDNILTSGTSLHSGDSVYFAIYPASFDFYNYVDRFAKGDTLGWGQYTSIGTQRIVIPHKLQ